MKTEIVYDTGRPVIRVWFNEEDWEEGIQASYTYYETEMKQKGKCRPIAEILQRMPQGYVAQKAFTHLTGIQSVKELGTGCDKGKDFYCNLVTGQRISIDIKCRHPGQDLPEYTWKIQNDVCPDYYILAWHEHHERGGYVDFVKWCHKDAVRDLGEIDNKGEGRSYWLQHWRMEPFFNFFPKIKTEN